MIRMLRLLKGRKLCLGIAVLLMVAGVGGTAQAVPVVFFGQDLGTGDDARLAAHPLASAAQVAFLSALVGVGTETFEGIPALSLAPLALTFPGAGTATLNGDGIVLDLPAPLTLAGQYPISGSKFWGPDQSFDIDFTSPIAAFGFFGTDIGDVGGQLTITLGGAIDVILTVPHTINGPSGSVLYFGVIDTENLYTKVTFANTTGADSFAFDDMTIGSLAQVVTSPPPPPPPVPEIPEPSSWLLMATGLTALSWLRGRRWATVRVAGDRKGFVDT